MKRYFILLVIFLAFFHTVFAQHENHQLPKKEPAPTVPDIKPAPIPQPKAPALKKPVVITTHPTEQLQKPVAPVASPDTVTTNHTGHQDQQTATPDTTRKIYHGRIYPGEGHITISIPRVKQLYYPGSMTHSFSLNLPMTRNGSGTSWNPDATPMYAYMFSKCKWNFMAHGNIFLRYTNHDVFKAGTRGDSKLDAPNWFMLMANRNIGGKGLLNFNLMMSLDPITEENGYPLLFQSGETYKGKPLVDRQHPHDLISALSIAYTHAFSEDIDLTGYFGYPGEPTIGPTAFMHRISAMNNPDAPLGHHWQDASHIQFGVATVGLRYRDLKIEGSNFTGREPNENRYNFDKPRFDSYSYRLQYAFYALNQSFVFQFSQGFLKSPEVTHPGEDVTRTTASLLFSEKWFDWDTKIDRHLTAALVWGYNKKDDQGEHAVLLEGNYQCRKMAYYTRYEFIQKSADELQITEDYGSGDHSHADLFNVHALTVGANRRIAQFWRLDLAAGAQVSVFRPEEKLHKIYGQWPLAGQVYLRLVPRLMQMHHH